MLLRTQLFQCNVTVIFWINLNSRQIIKRFVEIHIVWISRTQCGFWDAFGGTFLFNREFFQMERS